MKELLASVQPDTDALPRLLASMTRALERSAYGGDLAWLRALLIVSAEIEFTLARAPQVNLVVLADESRDLRELLTRPSGDPGDFAECYAAARAASQDLQDLHELVLQTCAALAGPDMRPTTPGAHAAVGARS
jgi:hypothetical protein